MPPPRQTPAMLPRGNYAPPPGGDSGRDPFSVVFALTGSTTFNGVTAYTGSERWVFGDGTVVEVVNGHVLTASQPGIPLDGTVFDTTADPPPLALARLGPGAGGRVWELAAFGASASSSATNCRAKLAGLRATECVLFDAPLNDFFAARSFGGRYVTADGGWKGWDFFETGDGITFPVLFRKDEGGMGLRLVGETTTWYAEFVGCVGGVAEFAVPYCPPDTLDGSGAGTGTGDCADLTDCTDHTFRVRVSCASCAGDGLTRARVTACEAWGQTAVTLYLTITGVTGSCDAGVVGKTVPLYYKANKTPGVTPSPGYVVLQADVDALGWPCDQLVGYPNNSVSVAPLFSSSACNLFWIGQAHAEASLTTDPFVLEGEWAGDADSTCCPAPPGGTIEFTLSEDAP